MVRWCLGHCFETPASLPVLSSADGRFIGLICLEKLKDTVAFSIGRKSTAGTSGEDTSVARCAWLGVPPKPIFLLLFEMSSFFCSIRSNKCWTSLLQRLTLDSISRSVFSLAKIAGEKDSSLLCRLRSSAGRHLEGDQLSPGRIDCFLVQSSAPSFAGLWILDLLGFMIGSNLPMQSLSRLNAMNLEQSSVSCRCCCLAHREPQHLHGLLRPRSTGCFEACLFTKVDTLESRSSSFVDSSPSLLSTDLEAWIMWSLFIGGNRLYFL